MSSPQEPSVSAEPELLGERQHAHVTNQVVARMAGNLTPLTNELVLLLWSNLETRF